MFRCPSAINISIKLDIKSIELRRMPDGQNEMIYVYMDSGKTIWELETDKAE